MNCCPTCGRVEALFHAYSACRIPLEQAHPWGVGKKHYYSHAWIFSVNTESILLTFMSILTLAAMMCTVTFFPGTLLSMACTTARYGQNK